MNNYISLVKKEFYHISRDKLTIMVLSMIFFIQMLLLVLSMSTSTKVIKVAVYDPSNDVSTTRIIEKLNANKYLTLVERLQSINDIQQTFKEGKASLVVVFGENFHNNLLHTGECAVQLISDGTQPNQSYVGYATNIITEYRQELLANKKSTLNIIPDTKMLYNPELKGSFNFVPGLIGVVLLLICTMMTALSIVRDKENKDKIMTENRTNFILSKVTSYFIIAVIDLCIMLLFAVFAMKIPIVGSLTLVITASLLFIIAALFLGVIIANLVNSQNAVMMISGIVLIMLTIILSGMVLAIESMPSIYQWVADIHPVRWFIQILRKVMIQGVDIIYVKNELIILTCMTVFFIFLSFITLKKHTDAKVLS